MSKNSQKGNTILIVLLGASLLVAVAAGAYYLGANKDVSNTSKGSVNQTTPSPQSSTTQIYTNTKHKFSLEYPKGWKYQYDQASDNPDSGVMFMPEEMTIPDGTETFIPVYLSISRKTYTEAVNMMQNNFGSAINSQDITAGGLSGTHVWGTIQEGPAQGMNMGAFILNMEGKAYTFDYTEISGKSYREEARQIVNSLKFE